MVRVTRVVQNYLMYSLPLVLICMAWGSTTPESEIRQTATLPVQWLWEVLSWNLMVWFAVLSLFLLALVASTEAREMTLKRLANLKERDELEQYITGRASRAAYVSTLSLLILLLFLSVFTLNIYRLPEGQAPAGKRGTVEIGLSLDFWDKDKAVVPKGEPIFNTDHFPVSKSAVLILILGWQLLIFNLTARREYRRRIGME